MKSNKKIPVILLHHNEFDFLYQSIESIYKNTKYPYKLFVVDNNSQSNDVFWLNLKKNFPQINIIFNKKNNWVYGFNLAIKQIKSDYYLLSDADIIFPGPKNNLCWLEYLVIQLNKHQSIGKIGLSLNLDLIKNDPNYKNLYKRELSYKKGKMIGDNIIAPVDTTAALYRSDLFMNKNSKFFMRVGHFSNMKPYYYCVRTSELFSSIHLGWKKYKHYKLNNAKLELTKKIDFFGLYGIKIEDELLSQVCLYTQVKYKFLLKIMRLYYFLSILHNYLIFTFTFQSKKYFKKLYEKQ